MMVLQEEKIITSNISVKEIDMKIYHLNNILKTINPKNEKQVFKKVFKWSVFGGLNYNKINEKELKKLLKFKRIDTDFSSHQRQWEEFEQNNTSIALNILFAPHNSEEIKLAYKSNYNKRKNQVILLMIKKPVTMIILL